MIVIKPLKDIPQFAQQIKTHLLCEFGNNIETLVAHDDNTFIGTVSLCDRDMDFGCPTFFVVSEYRGRGVGRMLVESIVKINQRLILVFSPFVKINQRLWTSDTKLVRFYESLGR